MKKRILAGVGANGLGMVITIGIQLLSLPLFLHFWSTGQYGTWLMLSAIPVYLSMADVGMVTAAGNKMNMAIGQGDVLEANRVFQSAQMFTILVCAGLAILVIPLVLLLPLHEIDSIDARLALLIMAWSVLFSLLGGLSDAVFKATERFAQGSMLGNYVRVGEWLGSMLGLWWVGSFTAVALGAFLVRIALIIYAIVLSQRGEHGIVWGTRFACKAEIRGMVKPAFSFMIFPLANAFSLQGITLLVGIFSGTASVALFNTYRTIARLALQVTGIFSFVLWPEFSRLFGSGGKLAVLSLFNRTVWIGAMQAVGMSVLLYFISPYVLKVWTHGRIPFQSNLMILMLVYAAIGGLWHIPRVLMMAINQHVNLAGWTLLSAALAFGITWFLGSDWQLVGAAWAMLISELFIALVCGALVVSFFIVKNESKLAKL